MAKRTIKYMIQTPTKLLKYWRANCDVKILLYDTDPQHPDIKEIFNVIDYLISYTCKGAETTAAEKNI